MESTQPTQCRLCGAPVVLIHGVECDPTIVTVVTVPARDGARSRAYTVHAGGPLCDPFATRMFPQNKAPTIPQLRWLRALLRLVMKSRASADEGRDRRRWFTDEQIRRELGHQTRCGMAPMLRRLVKQGLLRVSGVSYSLTPAGQKWAERGRT